MRARTMEATETGVYIGPLFNRINGARNLCGPCD